LPEEMLNFASPEPEALAKKLIETLPKAKNIPSFEFHSKVKTMYSWPNVGMRTVNLFC